MAKTQEVTAVIQYILTSAQSFGSQDYYDKSLMTLLGLAGALFCKMSRHGQNGLSFVPKKILTWVPREARGGLKAVAGKRQQPYCHFIQTIFCYFLFLSARVLFSLPGCARNHVNTSTLWAEARLNFEERIKQERSTDQAFATRGNLRSAT